MTGFRKFLPALVGAVVSVALLVWLWPRTSHSVAFTLGGDELEFLAPQSLRLLAAIPFALGAVAYSLADLPFPQRVLGTLLRGALLATLVLASARPARSEQSHRVATVFLVDVSTSIPDEAIARAERTIRGAREQSDDGSLQVVRFASRAERIDVSDDVAIPRFEGADATTSNVQSAMQLAYGLFPSEHLRRIVLFSDGNETAGDVLHEADRARDLDIEVDVVPMREGLPPEMAVSDVRLSDNLKVGEPFEVRARLYATRPTRVKLRLYQGAVLNSLDSIREVELAAGNTDVVFRSIVRVAGPVSYRLTAENLSDASNNRFSENDHFTASAIVPGKPTVLLVDPEESRLTQLASALSAGNFDVEVRSPRALPTGGSELSRFDFLLLSDAASDQVSLSQLAEIERFVQGGGGFLYAGGERGYALGGWQNSRLESILPVRMQSERRRDEPSLALALVIDRSGSMSGQKIELAKDAAKATAEMLSADDFIEVIGFDNQPERVVRMQSAQNRVRILRDIARMAPRGGTNIFPALDMAYQDLSATRARIKHVILLTDGQSPEDGITEVTQVMRAEGITVSTVGLGGDVARTLLQSIANLGGGRSYFTNDPSNVPRIFMRETSTVARSSAVEEYFQPIVHENADFLRGVPIASSPFLRGYVATQMKPRPAQLILKSELGEPILARWHLGLGWSLAWTSDVKSRWSADWMRWSGFSTFWTQLIREHMRERQEHHLPMRIEEHGDEFVAIVDALDDNDAFMNDLRSQLRLDGPIGTDGRASASTPLALEQVAPGRYEARFRPQGFGSFVLRGEHTRGGRVVGDSYASLSRPYPEEFAVADLNLPILEALAAQTSGRVDPSDFWDARGKSIRGFNELWPKLLWGALLLFFLDLLLRRVRIFDRDFRA